MPIKEVYSVLLFYHHKSWPYGKSKGMTRGDDGQTASSSPLSALIETLAMLLVPVV